jgi:hypothetical protein
MQTSNLDSKQPECPLLELVLERGALGQIVDHFQRALLHMDLLGPGIGAVVISGLFLLISLFHQAAHFAAEKGVI